MLRLMKAHGWKPAGTVHPNIIMETGQPNPYAGKPFDGYTSNDFQVVTDEDALAMSAALRRVLRSTAHKIPEEVARAIEQAGGTVLSSPDGFDRDTLDRMIEFFDQGRFSIW